LLVITLAFNGVGFLLFVSALIEDFDDLASDRIDQIPATVTERYTSGM
jgi:hypothetical protein